MSSPILPLVFLDNCLALSRQITDMKTCSAKLEVNLGPSRYSFSINPSPEQPAGLPSQKNQEKQIVIRRKKTPSDIRRNAKRLTHFLNRKNRQYAEVVSPNLNQNIESNDLIENLADSQVVSQDSGSQEPSKESNLTVSKKNSQESNVNYSQETPQESNVKDSQEISQGSREILQNSPETSQESNVIVWSPAPEMAPETEEFSEMEVEFQHPVTPPIISPISSPSPAPTANGKMVPPL